MAEDLVVPAPLANKQDSSDETSLNENHLGIHNTRTGFEICLKVDLPAHVAAFLSGQKLIRDCEQIQCDQILLENVAANYVIIKKILSFLPWQDKLMCKNVCSLWRSAVNTLQKEQIAPADFAICTRPLHEGPGVILLQSDCFYTEPLAVLEFSNASGFTDILFCEAKNVSACDSYCSRDHYFPDVVNSIVVAPKTCVLAVKTTFVSYMPMAHSKTHPFAITKRFQRPGHIGGIYIPVIPNVEFQIMNMKSLKDLEKNFYKTVDKLSETRYVKGLLVFVNESFLLQDEDDIKFLNYLRDVQPNVPYALGGCIVDDMADSQDIATMVESINASQDIVSDNLISIALFTVPKNFDDIRTENGCNFDMYSVIIDWTVWTKTNIQSVINEFSKNIPHFEHSVGIKMSCVGRNCKHYIEQDFFRTAFPSTRLVGCYGNGELGINLPARLCDDPHAYFSKRTRSDYQSIMYSYATVFVYIGWGRITKPAGTTTTF